MLRQIVLCLAVLSCTMAAPAQQESLLIGPGDLLQVDVIDTPEMEQQVRVPDNGNISLAYIGPIQVANQTPAAAALLIQNALIAKQVMLHPQVLLRVEEFATGGVTVLGQVKNPGDYQISTPQSILKVLSMSGGLTELADRHIVIRRHDGSAPVSYFASNNPRQAIEDVIQVFPGDTVLVAKAPVVYILGDVSRPGGYAITTNDSHLSLLQAIAVAGSARNTSKQSRVCLIRKSQSGTHEQRIHLDKIEKGKAPDLELEANDVLYVPFSWMKNVAMNSAQIAASTASAAIYVIP